MNECISEDDLQTLEAWLTYQALDASMMTTEELAVWQDRFEEARKERASSKVGLMNLKTVPGEHKYGVAVREGRACSLFYGYGAIEKGSTLF